jgi:hypothetical protein
METKYDNGERHLEEINHVSILESIDEVFDSATSLMTLDAVMYGSTVTALIAGLPICGDLDIAVSKQEYMRICQNFASSVKWLQVNGKRIPEHSADPERAYRLAEAPSSSNPYAKAKHLPVSKTATFASVNQSCVQIVESKIMTGDKLEDALEVVRKVDFTFCGMAVDSFGRMLEVIPHAYDDCLQRVIRIQNYQPETDFERMKHRLHKYIERGWGLTMSIDQAMSNLNKAKIEHAKVHGNKTKPTGPKLKKPLPLFMITKDKDKHYYIIETKKILEDTIPMPGHIRDLISGCATKEFGVVLNSAVNAEGRSRYWGINEPLTAPLAQKIVREATKKILSEHQATFSRASQKEEKEKNSRYQSMYGSGKPAPNYTGYVATSSGRFSTSTSASSATWGKT